MQAWAGESRKSRSIAAEADKHADFVKAYISPGGLGTFRVRHSFLSGLGLGLAFNWLFHKLSFPFLVSWELLCAP